MILIIFLFGVSTIVETIGVSVRVRLPSLEMVIGFVKLSIIARDCSGMFLNCGPSIVMSHVTLMSAWAGPAAMMPKRPAASAAGTKRLVIYKSSFAMHAIGVYAS